MAVADALSEGLGSPARKQRIPVLLIMALYAWLSCSLAFSLLRTAPFEVCGAAAFCAFGLALVLGVGTLTSLTLRRRAALVAGVVGVLLGAGMAVVGAGELERVMRDAPDQAVGSVMLAEDARPSSYGAQALVEAFSPEGTAMYRAHAYLPASALFCLRGDVLVVQKPAIGVEEQPTAYAWGRGAVVSLDVDAFERAESVGLVAALSQLRQRALAGLAGAGGAHGGLMQALACGYTRTIQETGAYEAYQMTGLAHLIAVSGSHLVIVVSLLNGALLKTNMRAGARTALCVGLIACYLVFSGLPVSGLRAGVMSLLALSARVAGRRSHALSAVGVCILAFLALDPSTALNASFVLSAGSTLGIALFSGLISSWFSGVSKRLRSWVVEPLAMTVASSITVQLYAVSLFAQAPLLALVANVVAAPLFAPACIASLIAALLAAAAPGASAPILAVAAVPAALLQGLAEALASIPYACISASLSAPAALGLTLVLCAGLYWWWPRMSLLQLRRGLVVAGVALATVACCLALYDASSSRVVMLDVGQGDAILLRSEGASVLVDTGTNDALLREALARNRVYRLDAVIITHADDDHCGSLEALAAVTRIGTVCVAADTLSCTCASCEELVTRIAALRGAPALTPLAQGDALSCGRFSLEVLWPARFANEGGNEDSLCLLATYEPATSRAGTVQTDWSTLLTGDLEAASLEGIVSAEGVSADVLKVGHHGSGGSVSAALLDALQPHVALVSVGENNRYGHPHADTLNALDQAGCVVLRTDVAGDVALAFDGDRIRVSTQRGP